MLLLPSCLLLLQERSILADLDAYCLIIFRCNNVHVLTIRLDESLLDSALHPFWNTAASVDILWLMRLLTGICNPFLCLGVDYRDIFRFHICPGEVVVIT